MLKAESNLGEATERAAALLQELRLRLNAETPRPEARETESLDELDRELQAYFSAATNTPAGSVSNKTLLNEIRDRVVEGVVDRIMRAWEDPQGQRSGVPGAIEAAVLERLIERVLERLGQDATGSRPTGRGPAPR